MLPPYSELLNNLAHIFEQGSADIGSIHPLIVHFPIALLCTAPLFILTALLFKQSFKPFSIGALLLMLIGSASIFLAVESGEHAAELLQANPAYIETLDIHYQLAEQSRLIFTTLSIIFLIFIVFNSSITKKYGLSANFLFCVIFLIVYTLALIILANTAHFGGKLVHKHHIHTSLYSSEK